MKDAARSPRQLASRDPAAIDTPRIYIITDRRAAGCRWNELPDRLDGLLSGLPGEAPDGAVAVQLREKDLSDRPLLSLAASLRDVTRNHRCALFINERLDIALAVDADGVHLPERGLDIPSVRSVAGPTLAIGVSTHSPSAAVHAARAGAALILLSPIWATPSKAAYGAPLGPQALADVRSQLPTAPILALGGVTTPARIAHAVRAGAHGIAGIRLFMQSQDPPRTIADTWALIRRQLAENRP